LPAVTHPPRRWLVGRRPWLRLLLVTVVVERWPVMIEQRFQFVAAIPARRGVR
jgi:hypothetical protein